MPNFAMLPLANNNLNFVPAFFNAPKLHVAGFAKRGCHSLNPVKNYWWAISSGFQIFPT